jgi:gliding motility-associated-like protein
VNNRSQYDRVRVQIFNRWGNIVYENEDYQDEWNGVDQNGKPLSEGVYFYTVLPRSDKFDYRDDKHPQLIHGFVHIVR